MNSFRAPDLQCFSALKLRSYQPPNLSSSKATTANIFPVKAAAAESSYHQANKSMEIKKSWFEAVRESVNNLAKGRLRLRYCCGLIAAALLPSPVRHANSTYFQYINIIKCIDYYVKCANNNLRNELLKCRKKLYCTSCIQFISLTGLQLLDE